MSSQTPNINLTLPTGAEKVSRQIINDNNTKIDTAIGTLNGNLTDFKNLFHFGGDSWRIDFDSDIQSNRMTIYFYTSLTQNIGLRLWLSPSQGVIQARQNENNSWTTVKTIW